MPILLKTNYGFSQRFLHRIDGKAAPITGYTVVACVKNAAKTTKLIADVLQVEDSNWAAGALNIVFPTVSDTLSAQEAWIEIATVISGTRYPAPDIPCRIEKGLIV